jgi:VCBS repeat-containing protein
LLVENGTTLNLNFQLPVASTGYAIQVLNSTQQPTQYFTIHEDGGQSVQGISFTAAGGSSGGVSIFFGTLSHPHPIWPSLIAID